MSTNSFHKYRDISESEEDDEVAGSFIQDEASEGEEKSLTVTETDSDQSDVVYKVKKKTKRRVIVSESEEENEKSANLSPHKNETKSSDVLTSDESAAYESDDYSHSHPTTSNAASAEKSYLQDTDDEEEQIERQALSPRTRQSITGFRPRNLTSDESDSEPEVVERTPSTSAPALKCKSKEEAEEISLFTDDEEEELHSYDPESMPNKSPVARTMNRTSANFNVSIANKLSSTLSEDGAKRVDLSAALTKNELSNSSNNSVKLLSQKEDIFEISSSSESSGIQTSTPTPGMNIIQPKINGPLSGTPKSSKKGTKLYVSKEFYEKELKKLAEMKSELSVCENLIDTLGSKLPDKGKRMSGRTDKLKQDIRRQADYISTLFVEESFKKEEIPSNKPFFNKNAPSWDELSAAVNQIQPKFTGKAGLATFNNQKALTIDRLKDIHGSLETCPSEDVLADQPKGLKATLMNHQRHALAWMNWRERQKPRGGILADDMGLGKTLTMISLVLDAKHKKDQDENNEEESSSDEDSSKQNPNGWSTKGRRDYYDGGTLVVCPASLIRQWESEVEKHTKRNLISVCVHHGNNRDTKARHLAKYDLVVTTYNLAARESKAHGTLFGIKWERIILDEAHVVRNHKSQSSEGVCSLRGKYRWALTGTPIQNKQMDLYAILKFLKCSPFDDLAHWKKWIDNKSDGGVQRLNTLMKSLMLRRTKIQLQENGSLQCLPDKKTELIEVTLEKDEMNVYQKIMIFSRTLFSQYLHQRAERNNDLYYKPQGERPTYQQSKDPNGAFYQMHQKLVKLHGGKEIQTHQILVLLLRLRQICCHPGLIDAMLEDEDDTSQVNDSDRTHPELDLLEQLDKLHINENVVGEPVLTDSLDGSKEQALYRASSKVLLKSNPVFDFNRPSSKIRLVLQVLEEKVLKTDDKAIVVSQWTGLLDILKTHLCKKGVALLALNGSIPVHKRQQIVSDFNDPKNRSKILLLSLTAGGVGLNLVGANHLLLMDLHWNPQLESQAQDRIYRVGQKKHVYVYKFMCKETVEERIKALQDHKLAIASGILTGVKAGEGSKLSMDDLKSLFGF